MTEPYLTVIELHNYRKQAEKLLTPQQMAEVITIVAIDPEIGAVIAGGNGLRKFRYAASAGRGKSGGARVIYLAVTARGKAYLIDIYAKNDKDNLSKADLNRLAKAASILKGETT